MRRCRAAGRTSRVGFAGVLATALMTSVLAGCTDGSEPGGPTTSPEPSATTSSAAPQAQTLRFSVYGGTPALRAYRDIATAFEADNPGVTVELVDHSDASAAAEDAFADLSSPGSPSGSPASPASESTPRSATPPDVFLLDEHYLPDLVSTGRLYPLDGELEERGVEFGDDYQRIALTAFSADNALQCMPFEMSPTVLFVNKRVVRYPRLEAEDIAPPGEDGAWRWEDFARSARVVLRDSSAPAFRSVHLPADADLLAALMRTAGGEIVDDVADPGSLTLDNDAGRQAMTAYVELSRQRPVVLSARAAQRRSPIERFTAGQLGFLFGSRADVPTLRESGVPFDALSVPGFGRPRTSSAISALCVDADSDVREVAVDFVAHAVSETSLTRAARSGALVPASLDVVNSAAFKQEGRRPRTVAPFIEGQKRTVLMPYSRGWRLAETRIQELMAELAANPPADLEAVLEERLPALDEESETWFEEAEGQE